MIAASISDLRVISTEVGSDDRDNDLEVVERASDTTPLPGRGGIAGPQWEQAFSAALDPMLILDDDQRIVDSNGAAAALLGHSREELVGHRVADLTAPRQRDRIARAWAALLLAGEGRGEWLLVTRRGGLVEVEASAAANIISGRHLVILRDITERKRAEARTARHAQQQEALAELGRMALSEGDTGELAQRAAEELARVLAVELVSVLELRASGEDLIMRAGVGWAEGATDGQAVAGTAPLGAFVVGTREAVAVTDFTAETRFLVPALLESHRVRSGISVAIGGGDDSLGVLSAYSRKHRRFAPDDVNFLQAIAHVLGAALARERMQRLESQLEQSRRLESVGQLAGGIAHDFNNLLSVIISYSGFALDELEPGTRLHDDISEIVTAAENGAELTKQLLLFSSRQVTETTTVDANQVVRDTGAILKRTIAPNIQIFEDVEPALSPVSLGRGQLEQILMNLATNARDAMPDGGSITLATEMLTLEGSFEPLAASLPSGPLVRIAVSDTGVGMSEEVLRQALEPFYTTKERGKGTGLGMATVYGIVEAAGGKVWIDSKPGRGTTVHVFLPPGDEEEAPLAPSDESPQQGHGESIVLVEDEPAARRATERILTSSGYSVTATADSEEALRISAEVHRIDVLVTDVLMPGISGIALAEKIRSRSPELAVVFISGDPAASDEIGRSSFHSWEFVEKPFSKEGLLSAVKAALTSTPPVGSTSPGDP